jgi:hypothetical protein
MAWRNVAYQKSAAGEYVNGGNVASVKMKKVIISEAASKWRKLMLAHNAARQRENNNQ